MFSWFMGLFRAKPQPPAPTVRATPARPFAREKLRDEAFWELLRTERGTSPALSDEDEALVSALLTQVIEHIVEQRTEPPTMPAIAPRILDVVREPEVDIAKLVRTLEQDQAISAKILSTANSAALGPSKEIVSLRDAIVYMGIEQTAQIAIGLATKSLFDADARAELSMYRVRWSRLFQHGMTTAFASANFAMQKFRRPSDEAFLGGLFHDVGRAVALRAIGALTLSGKWETPSQHVVDELLYRVPRSPDARLFAHWSLPSELMRICARHHRTDAVHSPASDIVSVVSSLDSLRAGSPSDKRYAIEDLQQSAERLRLSDPEIRAAHTETHEFAKRVGRMFAA